MGLFAMFCFGVGVGLGGWHLIDAAAQNSQENRRRHFFIKMLKHVVRVDDTTIETLVWLEQGMAEGLVEQAEGSVTYYRLTESGRLWCIYPQANKTMRQRNGQGSNK